MKKLNQFQSTMIRNVVVVLMIAGLAACSSSSSRDSDSDSPWRSKRAAELESAPSDSDVMMDAQTSGETGYDAGGLSSEPMPELMPEPMPEPIVEPEPVAVVPLTPEQKIMSMSASSYAVQVYAGRTKNSVEKYQTMYGLTDLVAVPTKRNGEIVHVLVSLQPDREFANQVAADLHAKTGTKPWVRSMSGLQSILVQ